MGTRVTGRRGLSTRRHVFGRRYVQGAEAAISATQQMRLKAQQGGRSCDAKKRADGGRLPSVGLRPPSASRPPSLSHLDCRWIPDLQKLTVRKARRRVSALHRSHRQSSSSSRRASSKKTSLAVWKLTPRRYTEVPYKSKPGSRSGDPSVFLHRGVGALFLAPLKTGQLAPPYQPG